ncbi:aldehyde dehydrogenase [Pseudobacteriovorax antillogorgiicola]|uniref:Aminomuconate-semialdehyde/2-hydroxymuconate-6-semialdehyde dehydrogenase n=1 Tax=Pseudobacteriovorax antillogorgiicola TaxID=1513793 RepID=A0A1Y6CG04_9BACT|nr:aldehyde dehydrogenase [Pseudobacteriovorax antillogorgiicola]TCS47641.1 aminomuconate-semialdehyde/2-hydroxymuconate-6-semialdehyde dehydrogenase [Pseudobacteriovorax antillogorgiicola]SMF59893.1 aminomuconate-semialdehyde/2-hydroxymuconate-6-semialdehyde dehydrogenase [Pseudobacteriovorax antillogorgiicola]
MIQIQNFINGEFRQPLGLKYIDNFEPATGKVFSQVPQSTVADVGLAVESAKAAAPAWAACSPDERANYLSSIAAFIRDGAEEFAQAESQDNGKPLSLARGVDIPRSALNFEFFAAAARTKSSESHHGEGAINLTRRDPLGVVACISPWNLPLYLLTWKIAPALAAGNTVVAKPSELTPYTAFLLGNAFKVAGLPPGVVNLVHGYGAEAGAPLCEHPDVKAISFTGGTATGRGIALSVASQFKKVSLEMGGKNANIVFADCDFDEAVHTSVRAAFANQGQICLCGSRILVESEIYEQFRDRFVQLVSELRVGDPLRAETDQGALVSKAHYQKVLTAIAAAEQEGGRVLCGGRSVPGDGRCEGGWFVAPTVIEGLGPQARTNQEEIFGPVVTLIPFEDEAEALEIANGTNYGLAASLWTQDLNRAHRLSAKLDAGIVWVNTWMNRDLRTPFGGMKESGLGREGGWEALRFFTEAKNICISYK